jgi:hypothetical protein
MVSPYERVPIAEVIPDSMKLRGLAKASVLTGHRRVRVIPQTGQAYKPSGGQSLANILVQDSAGLLDLQSVVLSFRLLTSSANGSLDPAVTAVPDDFAWSIIRRLQVSLNSQTWTTAGGARPWKHIHRAPSHGMKQWVHSWARGSSFPALKLPSRARQVQAFKTAPQPVPW